MWERRRMQTAGDIPHVTVDAHVTTPAEASRAIKQPASQTGGTVCGGMFTAV